MNLLGLILVAAAVILGTGRFVTQRRKRQQRATYPRPESLVIQPVQHVKVTRQADGLVALQWHGDAELVTVYAGSDAELIDRSKPLATTLHDNSVVIRDPSPRTRPYFEVAVDNQPAQIVAERRLPLQGIANMRDIGGYETRDGRHVRWGKVYRAGLLAGATDEDLKYLQNLNIQLVCDFRTTEEVETEPDRLPDAPQPHYLHLPVKADVNAGEQFEAIMFNPGNLTSLMQEGYTHQMIDANAHVFGKTLRHLADPDNLPAVIHCTAGKDRTGIAIAILLSVLGVPDNTIIADYSLSNQDYPHLRKYISKKFKQPYSFIFGVTVDDLLPILTADPALMRYALKYIRQHYGTPEDYLLQKAGLDGTSLDGLRANLLV